MDRERRRDDEGINNKEGNEKITGKGNEAEKEMARIRGEKYNLD